MTTKNLWLTSKKVKLTPTNILEEQAQFLKKEFKSKLTAQIITSYPEDETLITIAFYIVAKHLKGYNYRLLWFNQSIDNVFPFKINAFSNPAEDFGVVNNMEEFVEAIGKILGNTRTADILGNILTIGNAVKIDDED